MDEIMTEATYAQAKELFTHYTGEEDLRRSRALFEQLEGYKATAQYIEKIDTLLAYMIGNTVEYGTLNGAPIRWQVADKRGKMRLLIACGILFNAPYNADRVNNYWKTCDLRRQLNREFLKEHFSPVEQLRIMSTPVANPASEMFFTDGGEESVDKLFLLSLEEARKYLPEETERQSGEWWWLRTPGSNLLSAVGVYTDGSIYEIGINKDYTECGVRPAMWVMLKV